MDNKKTKTFLKDKYLCKDNVYRKAFRIKGNSNTIFVMYKRSITRASSILQTIQKKTKNVRGGVPYYGDNIFKDNIKQLEALREINQPEIQDIINILNKKEDFNIYAADIKVILENMQKFKNDDIYYIINLLLKIENLNELMIHHNLIDDLNNVVPISKIQIRDSNIAPSKLIENYSLHTRMPSPIKSHGGASPRLDSIKNILENRVNKILEILSNKVVPEVSDSHNPVELDQVVFDRLLIRNIGNATVSDDVYYKNIHYYFKGWKYGINNGNTEVITTITQKEYQITKNTEYKCYIPEQYKLQFVNGYTQWINTNVPPDDKLTIKINNIKNLIKQRLEIVFPEINMSGNDNLLCILLKHTLFCFPEIFAYSNLYPDNAVLLYTPQNPEEPFIYPLYNACYSIDYKILGRHYHSQLYGVEDDVGKIITHNKRLARVKSNPMVVKFRQFERGTCAFACTMNALDVLQSIGINIEHEHWKQCKDTLDVNLFAQLSLVNYNSWKKPRDIGKGFNPCTLWHFTNNFGIPESENITINNKVDSFSFTSAFLKACINLLKTNNYKINSINNLTQLIKDMLAKTVGIVGTLNLGNMENHVITVHKISDDDFFIYDSNFVFVHTNVEEYFDEYAFSVFPESEETTKDNSIAYLLVVSMQYM